ncbi:hypothetical protein D8674_026257 [Pyrus ussuriensis x Pyrus communis]|uniref:BURP domain-containing protein n=1 Tax=Pyrus ussuriensis x Pyrus communis TaxID=2448454 RepID=A0A5N5I9F5_9ROSA|nr:hypothetical protein D8674_026257 [Pyrus ussuriensis x Pyrus communis]
MPKALSQLVQPDVVQNDPPFRHYPKIGVLNRVIFFVEKDMHPRKTMKHHLATNSTRATFLSHKTAESIPFSSLELPEIFNQYSVKPRSVEEGFKGEEKQCTTSLESMIEYNYTISLGMKNLSVANKKRVIVCHKMSYLYAIHYCHTFGRTKAYMVLLQGSDGTTAKAVAQTHLDGTQIVMPYKR